MVANLERIKIKLLSDMRAATCETAGFS
jgi:hypothetical protein